MSMQAIENYTLAVDIGRSGGTDHSKRTQYVEWIDGQFNCQLNPHTPAVIVPRVSFTHLYLMKSGDTIKLGMSKNPSERQRSLKTGAAQRLELLKQFRIPKDGARMKEATCHRLLRPFRTAGEWFRVKPITAELIVMHVTDGTPDRAAITAILEIEEFDRDKRNTSHHRDRERLEMAIRANPTIPSWYLTSYLPRIMI